MDEPKGLFQLSVSVVNLQTKHPRNAGLGHDLQEYSNEVFLSLASAGGPLGDVTVARSRELWPGPCDHFHPVVVQSKELPTSTTHGRETGAHKNQCCKRLGLCLPKSVLMK